MELKLLDKKNFYENLDSLIGLYNLTFNNKITKEYYYWRYIHNLSDDFFLAVAISKGEVVSSESMVPLNLYRNNKKYKCAMSIHNMTHPKYKGKGLIIKLGELLQQKLKEKKYDICISFPNKHMNAIKFKKHEWKDIYEFPMLTKVVEEKYEKIDFDDNFIYDYSNFNVVKNRFYIKKSNNYLKWRYTNNPINQYKNIILKNEDKIMGYCVVKEYEEKLNIVELHYKDENTLKKLIVLSESYASLVKKEKLTSWANINSNEKIDLEKLGFKSELPLMYFHGKILNKEKKELDYNPSNWKIMLGDHNVF